MGLIYQTSLLLTQTFSSSNFHVGSIASQSGLVPNPSRSSKFSDR